MTATVDVTLFWISFWGFLCAFVLFTLYAALSRESLGRCATGIFLAATAALTAGLAARWVISTHAPFSTMYEYALTMAWFVALSFVVIIARFRRMILGIVVSPILIIVLVIASLLPKEISQQLMPALQSYWFYIHVTLAAIAEGAFFVSAGAGLLYLLKGTGGMERGRLPAGDFLEELMARSIRIGYPLFTIGALFAGAIWARSAWGSFWSWDPKETGSLVVWLFYTLLLHQNIRGSWRGRTLAVLTLVGFAVIIVSFLGNLFFGGLHSYI
jgi:cytochrome c-type biogenesis protein CcsB